MLETTWRFCGIWRTSLPRILHIQPKNTHIKNPTNWMFKHFVRAVSQLQPTLVVFENVRGLLETADSFFLKQLIADLATEGYKTDYTLMNAQDFGVPQTGHGFS
nr:DNA cytosine methyltransferase [Sphingopyxis sp. BSNA05]